MPANKGLWGLTVLAALAIGGCVSTFTPGRGTHNEWAGTYAKEQAQRKDADRAIALRVRKALADNSQLNALGLRLFLGKVR